MARRRKSKRCSTNMRKRRDWTHVVQRCSPTSFCSARKDEEALVQLDAWLCDLKEMRINDGLHVFGHSPDGALRDEMLSAYSLDEQAEVGAKLDACGPAEMEALVHALRGGFVQPAFAARFPFEVLDRVRQIKLLTRQVGADDREV